MSRLTCATTLSLYPVLNFLFDIFLYIIQRLIGYVKKASGYKVFDFAYSKSLQLYYLWFSQMPISLMPYIIPIVGSIVVALASWGIAILKSKIKLEEGKVALDQID